MKKNFDAGSGVVTVSNKNGDADGRELTPKQRFELLIEAYKKQNPEKYEQKKALLEAQLAAFDPEKPAVEEKTEEAVGATSEERNKKTRGPRAKKDSL